MARNKDSKPVKQQKVRTGGESTVHPLNFTPKTRVFVKQVPVEIAPGFKVHPRKASRARRRWENKTMGNMLVLHPEFLRDCRLADLLRRLEGLSGHVGKRGKVPSESDSAQRAGTGQPVVYQ